MTKVIGTLKDLDVKPGDVVEWLDADPDWWDLPRYYRVASDGYAYHEDGGSIPLTESRLFRIVSRANKENDQMKLWKDMTPEEKGALLLAHHEGKLIESLFKGVWCTTAPSWLDDFSYRAKPEPKREVATLYVSGKDTDFYLKEIGTIDLIDGEPDLESIRMENCRVRLK